MTLDDAVDLVLHAFEQGNNGDIFVQKAPAATIHVLAQAIVELMNQKDHPINIIGTRHGEKLYEAVIRKSLAWGHPDNMMFVVGATHPEVFSQIRALVPDHFLLVPGVGTQGGDLHQIARNGLNKQCGLLVNVSRNIIYADGTTQFADAARKEALQYQSVMSALLKQG